MGATLRIPKMAAHAVLGALVAQFNATREALVGSAVHATATSTGDVGDLENPAGTVLSVTAADASDTATAVALANDAKVVLNAHFADKLAHDSAVSSAVATANATDQASAITLANAIKAAYEAHRTAADVHFNNDTTNTIAASDATDAASLYTLLNEIKTDLSAHIAASLGGAHIELV